MTGGAVIDANLAAGKDLGAGHAVIDHDELVEQLPAVARPGDALADLPNTGGKARVRAEAPALHLLQRPAMPVAQRNLVRRRIGRKLLLAGNEIFGATGEQEGNVEREVRAFSFQVY